MGQTSTRAAPTSIPSSTQPRRILASVIGVFLLAFVLTTLFIIGMLAILPPLGITLSDTVPFILVGIVPQLIMLVVGYLYMSRLLRWFPLRMPSLRQIGIVFGGTVAALVLAILFEILFSILSIPPQATLASESAEANPTVYLLIALVSVVLVGPAEEFLYRGAFSGSSSNHFRTSSVNRSSRCPVRCDASPHLRACRVVTTVESSMGGSPDPRCQRGPLWLHF